MKERFARFMAGRNGNDQLNTFLLYVVCASIILGLILKKVAFLGSLFNTLGLAALVLLYFRMLSKNINRRSEENGKFIRMKYKVFGYLKAIKERWVQRKDYKFFTCPSCRAVLRVPRGHGKIKIVCRKCGNTFIGKS